MIIIRKYFYIYEHEMLLLYREDYLHFFVRLLLAELQNLNIKMHALVERNMEYLSIILLKGKLKCHMVPPRSFSRVRNSHIN
jgi:hypothetical protein